MLSDSDAFTVAVFETFALEEKQLLLKLRDISSKVRVEGFLLSLILFK